MSCGHASADCWPALTIIALAVWSYYVYVIEFCVYDLQDEPTKQILYLVIFHLLFIMLGWTYFKVMCTDIGVVPKEYKIPSKTYLALKNAENDEERNQYLVNFCNSREITVFTRNENGYIRFCNKCKQIKPDRTHHCSTCGTCVLKMDHHCPWINNCIGVSNYKFFIQFLFYSVLYCNFYVFTTLGCFLIYVQYLQGFTEECCKLYTFITFFIAVVIDILMIYFFYYHLSLASKNQTTLEVIAPVHFSASYNDLTYNLGMFDNFIEVLGDNCCLWFFPIDNIDSDGIDFRIRSII